MDHQADALTLSQRDLSKSRRGRPRGVSHVSTSLGLAVRSLHQPFSLPTKFDIAMVPPRHIAILGGGLTGLSSAFHLARKFPQALITLLEQNTKLGGWAQSERVEVKDSDGVPYTVLLEAGPRTLRPNAKSVLELVGRSLCYNVIAVDCLQSKTRFISSG